MGKNFAGGARSNEEKVLNLAFIFRQKEREIGILRQGIRLTNAKMLMRI